MDEPAIYEELAVAAMKNKLNYQQYLTKKKELYETFLSLSQKEQHAIAARNYDLLLQLLTEKDMVIAKVNQIDDYLGTFTEHGNQDVDNLKADIINLLNTAKEIDEQNKNVLKKELDVMAELLKQTHYLKKTHSLYKGDEIPIEGILIDKKK